MNKKKSPKQKTKVGAIQGSPLKTKKTGFDYNLFFLWAMILLVSIIRYRLITVPFERDEGEYGYIGSLFLHGIAPFKGAYTMKLPGTPFMYAVLMFIFGHTNSGVHLGMVFINAATMYFLFAAFKKMFSPFIGISASSIYGLMAIGFVFDGFAAHATQFICFYTSIALVFLAGFIKSGKPWNIFLSGLMFGMAFLMKQQAIFLVLFGALFLVIYVMAEKKQGIAKVTGKLLLYGSGVLIPYLLVVLIIIMDGQFSAFWLWTVRYASTYEAPKGWDFIFATFTAYTYPVWVDFTYFWLLALGGILVLFWTPYTRTQKLFVLLYVVASACVVCAGFYFRPHYYVVILPTVGLLMGIFIEFAVKQIRERGKILKSSNTAFVILAIPILFNIIDMKKYYFSYTPTWVCKSAYIGMPFDEAPVISKYIREHTKDTDKIAVFGSEPEIYFYADRMAATGFLYTFPLVEKQPYNGVMQEDMAKEIEKNKPAYLVVCLFPSSWGVMLPGIPRTIFEWGNKYTHDYYTPVGFIDYLDDNTWRFYWDNDIKNDTIHKETSIIVLKRNL